MMLVHHDDAGTRIRLRRRSPGSAPSPDSLADDRGRSSKAWTSHQYEEETGAASSLFEKRSERSSTTARNVFAARTTSSVEWRIRSTQLEQFDRRPINDEGRGTNYRETETMVLSDDHRHLGFRQSPQRGSPDGQSDSPHRFLQGEPLQAVSARHRDDLVLLREPRRTLERGRLLRAAVCAQTLPRRPADRRRPDRRGGGGLRQALRQCRLFNPGGWEHIVHEARRPAAASAFVPSPRGASFRISTS